MTTRLTSAPAPMAAPSVILWLGYGGLVPFIGCAIATHADPAHASRSYEALVAYGAVILSFVGALHWGFAMTLDQIAGHRRRQLYIWSVIPSLLAWLALILHSMGAALLLTTGFLMHFWQDRRLAGLIPLPVWYLPLRLRLSVIAILCLAAGATSPGATSHQELLMNATSPVWTMARPSALAGGLRTGRGKMLEDPGKLRDGIMSRAGVAAFLVRQIECLAACASQRCCQSTVGHSEDRDRVERT